MWDNRCASSCTRTFSTAIAAWPAKVRRVTRSASSNSSSPTRSYSASTPRTESGMLNGTAMYVRQAGSPGASTGPSRSTRPRRATPVPATQPSSPDPTGSRRPGPTSSSSSISRTTPDCAPVAARAVCRITSRMRCRSWVLDRVSPSRPSWPRSWSRDAVRAATYDCISRVIRLNVAASRPTSSRARTGTRADRSPSATRSAAAASSASGRVVPPASQRAAATAPAAATSTTPSSTGSSTGVVGAGTVTASGSGPSTGRRIGPPAPAAVTVAPPVTSVSWSSSASSTGRTA